MPSSGPSKRRSAERFRSQLWMWPAGATAASLVAGAVLVQLRPEEPRDVWAWSGDVDAARALFQVSATAVMTATALTFSVTVVALQLASQQFSPRLLREFGRDPVTKRVLSILAATFVFCLAALTGLDGDEPVPIGAVLVGLALAVASLGAILGFITHIVRVIRVDTMMLVVHDEADAVIRVFYPRYDDDPGARPPPGVMEAVGPIVSATSSGFVQSTDVALLVDAAAAADVLVRLDVRAGDHLVEGTPMATVLPVEPGRAVAVSDELADGVRRAVQLGYERTMDQDAGFGLRQLEDIAVKAMSPSVNDPVTAAHAVGHLSRLLVALAGSRLGPTLHEDPDGIGRAVVPDRDLRYYLDLSSGQLRRFAAREPSVLIALLRMLRDVAVACHDDGQRAEVRRAARLVVAQLDAGVLEDDAAGVHDAHERVERALEGDLAGAFHDRAGEIRSI